MERVTKNGMDRRQHPRVRVRGNAVVSAAGRMLGLASVENVSLTGAMLAGKMEPPAVGGNVRVMITSGKLLGAAFQAEVRWGYFESGKVKFGVRILPQQPAVAGLIRNVLLDDQSHT